MSVSELYVGSDKEPLAVLHQREGHIRTYAVIPMNFPKSGSDLAMHMNRAFREGKAQAQAEMRASLGLRV